MFDLCFVLGGVLKHPFKELVARAKRVKLVRCCMAEQLGLAAQATEGLLGSRHSQDFVADLVRGAPAKVSTFVVKHRIINGLGTLELLGVGEDINEVVVALDPGLAA
jgi:hypothetical protein